PSPNEYAATRPDDAGRPLAGSTRKARRNAATIAFANAPLPDATGSNRRTARIVALVTPQPSHGTPISTLAGRRRIVYRRKVQVPLPGGSRCGIAPRPGAAGLGLPAMSVGGVYAGMPVPMAGLPDWRWKSYDPGLASSGFALGRLPAPVEKSVVLWLSYHDR